MLKEAEAQGGKCLTTHADFDPNMLSEAVLKIDICRYLEDKWPLDDEDLDKMHKLYGLVAYQLCSCCVFHILGKRKRRPLPACVYTRIREYSHCMTAFILILNMQKNRNGKLFLYFYCIRQLSVGFPNF